ncbi:LysR family transcriptional regulator [Sediminicoccus rosea]|jgi:DNA-binding transcriptional LysR family regulator|uniref:LysR family transcriptional regulator n=1 Tax=Sediminicoccus rosea TaxID=1225128 RepID=A0ABZ0PNK7_9PROT|nr:LysR family transcriptional regulator [Sediminicoccus rosea]WPB87313.1 LysR family transcriptional regulator [Sediminicoccus rosea]
MLEIRDLRLILAIDEHGSLLRASRALGVAQSAVTRGLAAVEARLRGPLFERTGRGTITTDLGRAVLADARDILERMAGLDRHLAEARGSQVRDLNIVAGSYVAESLALAAAGRMVSLYPELRLRLTAANWAEVARAVLEREAPLGLLDLRGFQGEAGLELEALRPQPGLFVVRPDHPLTRLAAVTLPDIMAHPFAFIGRAPREVQAPLVRAREAARAAGAIHPAFPALVHESPTVALSLVSRSDAVVAVTTSLAARALRLGEVVALRWREPWVSVHPGILRLRGRPLGEAEQAFLDLLRDADAAGEREGRMICAELGLSPDCA